MVEFDRIKNMIYDELDEISHNNKLSKDAICIIGELVDILKDIGSVEMFEEGINISEDDYASISGYTKNNSGYSQRRMPVYYNDGNSYRGGYGHYDGGYGGHMRHGGYSRADAKEHMVGKLEDLMHEAQDEKDKHAIKKLIEQMESN